MLYGLRESQRRRRAGTLWVLRHLPAALQQMAQTTLMEREGESIIGRPAVVDQKAVIFGPQNQHGLFVSSAGQNGIYGHLSAHRHVQPLEPPAHLQPVSSMPFTGACRAVSTSPS